ncbi:hypothetical protein [Microtetraspora glauca]|uniref:Core-binding (CB) domain-containing protein n=1 Tax=Microtetraspora glauca TaxID=1996 RepID=A0ABV3GNQ9_MICGL
MAKGNSRRTGDLYLWLLKKRITPCLGGVRLGKLSTAMSRQWRADLLGNGVSVSMAAKAYRLLRAVLMTAEDDQNSGQSVCRIRGAGDKHPEERPVLTVAQVFELADWVGRRPVGNVRKLKNGAYRLRFQRHGEMRTHPEGFTTRGDAERALWKIGMDGRADLHAGPVVPRLGGSGFNTRTRWVDVVKEIGMPGLHFHDLRHTGNMLAPSRVRGSRS